MCWCSRYTRGHSVAYHSFNEYLLSAYCVPSTGLKPGTAEVKKKGVRFLPFWSLHSTESTKNSSFISSLTLHAKAKLNLKWFYPWAFLIKMKIIQIHISRVPFPWWRRASPWNIPHMGSKVSDGKGHVLGPPPTWPIRGFISVPRPGSPSGVVSLSAFIKCNRDLCQLSTKGLLPPPGMWFLQGSERVARNSGHDCSRHAGSS